MKTFAPAFAKACVSIIKAKEEVVALHQKTISTFENVKQNKHQYANDFFVHKRYSHFFLQTVNIFNDDEFFLQIVNIISKQP